MLLRLVVGVSRPRSTRVKALTPVLRAKALVAIAIILLRFN